MQDLEAIDFLGDRDDRFLAVLEALAKLRLTVRLLLEHETRQERDNLFRFESATIRKGRKSR